jgi:L-alanine-DL-glutamate epimerase-like enolase superfamily enzyme
VETLSVTIERFPIAGAFTISRGSRTEAVVVTATVTQDGATGRAECVPYARYDETVEGVADLIRAQEHILAAGGSPSAMRAAVNAALPGGAARNALDCALWDLEARQSGRRVWDLAGLPAPVPVTTCYTLSLGDPARMADAARGASFRPLLKVKLGGEGDEERIAAVREGAPASRIVVDANEAWDETTLPGNLAACVRAGVEMIEQPLPAGRDGALAGLSSPIPICADESLHDRGGLASLAGRYGAINVKLDKTGGLTEAIALVMAARDAGFKVMVGCMLGTSLGMAPALLLAGAAAVVDLDGPLLLARDREPGLMYEGALVHPPARDVWG